MKVRRVDARDPPTRDHRYRIDRCVQCFAVRTTVQRIVAPRTTIFIFRETEQGTKRESTPTILLKVFIFS